jgi:hypothetical protein
MAGAGGRACRSRGDRSGRDGRACTYRRDRIRPSACRSPIGRGREAPVFFLYHAIRGVGTSWCARRAAFKTVWRGVGWGGAATTRRRVVYGFEAGRGRRGGNHCVHAPMRE